MVFVIYYVHMIVLRPQRVGSHFAVQERRMQRDKAKALEVQFGMF